MAETKICEQCQREQDIECFYRRPQKHDPNKRIKICIDCYKQNLAESKRRQEEHMRRWQEEQQQREAQQEAERLAREQEQQVREQARQARALERSIQANKRCPRCKQLRTDGKLWMLSNGEEHFYFSRFCQACTDATPHVIYRLICPVFNQIRYVGITSQPIKQRLAGHMRGESGTEQKLAWIDQLRARNLTAQIEVIDTSPNEREALKAEQAWIDHHIRLGCPLTNSEVSNVQHVLDLQSGRLLSSEERRSDLYGSARHFGLVCASTRRLEIARWRNRTQCAYFLDSTYNPHGLYAFHHYTMEAKEYDYAIFEHALPESKRERKTMLCEVTIAYLYWDETQVIWQKVRKCEDIRYLWDKHIPFTCTRVEKDGTRNTGFVTGLAWDNAPIIHPFSCNVDPARTLLIKP